MPRTAVSRQFIELAILYDAYWKTPLRLLNKI